MAWPQRFLALALALGAACGSSAPGTRTDAGGGGDGGGGSGDGGGGDGGGDGGGGGDADAMPIDAAPGVITGGPCASGAPGAAAYRIRWDGNGAGSTAHVVYLVNGLPDQSRDHAGAFGYQIGFTPTFDDPYLADGGLVLDSSDFVDLELSTVGVTQISSATLSLLGRSFNTTTPGSFAWQTFDGTGAAPTDLVSNSAPYQWYSADMTTELSPDDGGVLLRITSGPSSDVLVVNQIELCLQAT